MARVKPAAILVKAKVKLTLPTMYLPPHSPELNPIWTVLGDKLLTDSIVETCNFVPALPVILNDESFNVIINSILKSQKIQVTYCDNFCISKGHSFLG